MASQYTVTGFVDPNGTVLGGTGGFVVEHVDNGVYTILFQPQFVTTPVVVTSQVYPNDLYSKGGSTLDNALLIGVDQTRVRIHTGDGKGNGWDRAFTFIAIGVGPALEDIEIDEAAEAALIDAESAEGAESEAEAEYAAETEADPETEDVSEL